MTLIRRSNPLGELVSLRQAMDRLFEDSWVRPRGSFGDQPDMALDIKSTGDEIVVEAALPGIKPEDVDVSVLGDTLTISASHRDESSRDEEGYSYREIRRGSFSRTITLPSGVKTDSAMANFENGMLTLRLPKAEEAKPRQIRISPTTEHQPAETQSVGAGVSQADAEQVS
ncbi:MAG TPA: Hsp20/alpha crystallin family protein [Candidatus Limnocylindrales bacterium]|jgi:HSP20 family protein